MSSKPAVCLLRGVSAFSILSVLGIVPALAQQSASPEPNTIVLDEVTVSGENVERDLKETASSVAVIGAKQIETEKTGDPSVSQVIAGTPNVLQPGTVGAPVIRGMDSQGPNTGANAFVSGTVPRATINIDGHYLSYNEFYFGATSVWDVDSIEVFRGPQTTSQGANAIAGAIIVNTKDPTFAWEGAYQAEVGSYNTSRASFMLSGPIIKDELAMRFAVDYSGRDTFIDYVNPSMALQPGETDIDFNALNTRAKLLWQPKSIPGLEAKLTYAHNSSNRPSQENATKPFELLESETATMPTWNQSSDIGILNVNYDFMNGFKLFNQAQYSDLSVHRVANVASNGNADIAQTNMSNESRLLFGNPGDVLSGVAGVFLANTQTEEALYIRGVSTFDDTKDNIGVFGEVSYRLTDRWTLTGSLRYEQDRVQRSGTSVYASSPLQYDETFSALLPKISLAYALTPEWTVGGLVSRGYNPGGVSLNFTSRQWQPFLEESLWNYEFFIRANPFGNRMFVNVNVFYTDIKDMQFNIPVVIAPGVVQSYTINAQKAHTYGAEGSIDYRVFDNLTLRAGVGVLHTQIDEILSNDSYQGNEFPVAPGLMMTFGANWDVTDRFNVSGQIRYVAGYFSNIANTVDYAVAGYTIADLRASYRFADGFQVYGYAKNIFDERAATYIQQNRSVVGGVEASMTEPRMLGIGVRGTF